MPASESSAGGIRATRATALVALPESHRAGRRVVVVNDDQSVLALYAEMLRELDYQPVVMATMGIETDRIREAKPDAVILDLQVGLQSEYGVEMALQLRADAHFAAIPIVVCTGDASALYEAAATLREIDVPVLLKPFTVADLGAAIDGRAEGTAPPIVEVA